LTWENKYGQLSFIEYIIDANPDTINFNTTKRKINIGSITPKKQSIIWNSLDLIETLLNLGLEEKNYNKLKSIFEACIKKFPEQLLIGIAESDVINFFN
jgi:hypothetical protein